MGRAPTSRARSFCSVPEAGWRGVDFDDAIAFDLAHFKRPFDHAAIGETERAIDAKEPDEITDPTMLSAFQTLATYTADYENSHDSESSDDDSLWCDTRNAYYDGLDF